MSDSAPPLPRAAVDVLAQSCDPADLRVELWPPTPARGMLVPRINQGVKVTHLPTGLAVVCEEHRAMHHNRNTALAQLAELLKARA